MRRKRAKFGKRLVRLLLVLFVGAAGVLLLLWIQHRTPLTLPLPTGRFPVGRTSFDWMDEARIDPLAPRQGTKRELTVWIWYPASVAKSSIPAPYEPEAWRVALADHQGTVFQNFLKHDPTTVRCHSSDNADVAADQRMYPVILMKPGIGALALDYTTLCEDLASHGYIVVASDSPYNTFLVVYPDGRIVLRSRAAFPSPRASSPVIGTWAADNRFLLDRLTRLNQGDPSSRFQGRLNLQAVGVFGHSFGGATAAEFCHEDARCRAGIDVDGRPFGPVIRTGVDRPFMFLLADHSGTLDAEDRQIQGDIRSIYDRLPRGRFYATVRGSGHFNFSDACLMFNSLFGRVSRATGNIGDRRGLQIAAACISTFLDVHLKGGDPSLMERLPVQYPELRLGPDNH
jgi:predicted dienelactone hydrolase